MTSYLDFTTDFDDPRVAETFDDFTYWSSMFGQLLFRHLSLEPELVCLDVGCGTGFPLVELADRLDPASSVHGIDSWDHAVARARLKVGVRGNTNIHVTHGDAANMPYDDATFDLLVSNLGVNNFDSPSSVMAECSRVCKPGGRFALTTNLVGHMSEFYDVYQHVLIDAGHEALIPQLQQHIEHRTSPGELDELFIDAGFEPTHRHSTVFSMRYANGSAFLNSYLSRVGFLSGWTSLLAGPTQAVTVFETLEARLNDIARQSGDGLRLSIPAMYFDGRKR